MGKAMNKQSAVIFELTKENWIMYWLLDKMKKLFVTENVLSTIVTSYTLTSTKTKWGENMYNFFDVGPIMERKIIMVGFK